MNTQDACPHDLLARATRAPLAPAERSQLAVHLARCATCRAAADVAAALADEPSALPGDELLVARLAARAAEAAGAGRRVRWPAYAAAATLLVALSAFASIRQFARSRRAPLVSSAAAGATVPPPVADSTAPVPGAVAPTTAPVPNAPPRAAEAKNARRTAATPNVERLLADARRARMAGDGERARALYARLARLAPGTPAAAVAEMGIGLILVERPGPENARAALEGFDRYLAAAPDGALREEAIAGRARALDALGERAQAAAVWRQLLDDYPLSVQAPLARRRLEALGGSGAHP
jgi:hypothetical protein